MTEAITGSLSLVTGVLTAIVTFMGDVIDMVVAQPILILVAVGIPLMSVVLDQAQSFLSAIWKRQ